jgi:hypothetical protein
VIVPAATTPIGEREKIMMKMASKLIDCTTRVAGSAIAGVLLVTGVVHAQEKPAPPDAEQVKKQLEIETGKLDALQRSLNDQEQKMQADRRALQDQRRRLDDLKRLMGGSVPAQPAQAASPPTTQPQTVGQAPAAPEKPPEVAPLFQQPGVLTPMGKFIFEPSLEYDYSTNSRVTLVGFTVIPAINIGFFDVSRVNRNTATATLAARFGITNRFEVEARLPYVYRRDETLARPFGVGSGIDELFGSHNHGIGDFEMTGRYQINEGGLDKPYYVGSLRLKSRTGKDQFSMDNFRPFPGNALVLQKEPPTGSGFIGIQPGLSMIFPSDPAVFFGGITYQYNIRRNINDPDLNIVGKVDPGDIIGFNFGMGLGINEKASFSIGYDHSYVNKPKLNGQVIPLSITSQLGTLLLGYSYRLSPKMTANLSLGVGVTRDAPDLQLRFRLPMSF